MTQSLQSCCVKWLAGRGVTPKSVYHNDEADRRHVASSSVLYLFRKRKYRRKSHLQALREESSKRVKVWSADPERDG